LQEIGQELAISRERVRQLQVKLLGKLRRPRSRELLEEALLCAARNYLIK
jgi:DNA-directed RNA polymerase sigma subunit (sigma70/sigma32)